MLTTKLSLHDILPLTCTRTGTCCHGNRVFLNPWELAALSHKKQFTPTAFRDQYTESGGIVLRFNGKNDHRGKPSCSQYIENFGCSVHEGRPLACRLFPLGRQVQNGNAEYIFQGENFPCLDGCAAVVELPHLSVEDYLCGQQTLAFEKAQDAYLEVMQNLADNAFALLLDSGLAASGDTKTLKKWRELGKEEVSQLAKIIGNDWNNALMLPTIDYQENSNVFAELHNEQMQQMVQAKFGTLTSMQECQEASCIIMGLALYLAHALGADAAILSEHWIEEAKNYGALEL